VQGRKAKPKKDFNQIPISDFQSTSFIHFEDPRFEFSETTIALNEIYNILFLNLEKLLKIHHVLLFQNQLGVF